MRRARSLRAAAAAIGLFEIARKGSLTEVRFTHVGLVPDDECYGACSNAWASLINGSLRTLMTTGVAARPSF